VIACVISHAWLLSVVVLSCMSGFAGKHTGAILMLLYWRACSMLQASPNAVDFSCSL
jgi:hypothetical protein